MNNRKLIGAITGIATVLVASGIGYLLHNIYERRVHESHPPSSSPIEITIEEAAEEDTSQSKVHDNVDEP